MSSPFFQPLEGRLCLSVSFQQNTTIPHGPSVSFHDGILIVRGTPGDDRIIFSFPSGNIAIIIPGQGPLPLKLSLTINGKSGSFDLAGIKQIRIDAGAGNDKVSVLPLPAGPCALPGSVPIFTGADDITIRMSGGAGNDTLIGGDADDTIHGGSGNDIIYGRAGDDHIFGDSGNDKIAGNGGDDSINGSVGIDKLWGEDNSTNSKDTGSDTLVGGEGADLLFGGSGDDLLIGGTGNDALWGGPGADSARAGKGFDSANSIEGVQESIERQLPDSTIIEGCEL